MRPASQTLDHAAGGHHHAALGRDEAPKPRPAASPVRPSAELPDARGHADAEPRSNYGSVPGAEFPGFVYISVLAAFAWIMVASWLAFAADTDAALALGIAIVLGLVFFALPVIIRAVAAARATARPEALGGDFLARPVETGSGPLTGASAWLQVLLIPLSLALAATLIGMAFLLVR